MSKLKKIMDKQYDIDYPINLGEEESQNVGGIYDVYKKGFMSAMQLKDDEKRLDLANAQLIGYFAGKWTNLIGMIEAMDLSKKEWIMLKKQYEPNLDKNDFNEIEEYFKIQK